MAKKGTTGYQAKRLREMGQRRIERLQAVLGNENTSERVRNWAERQKKEITSAMQGTRQYSKSGKRYKSKSESYIKGQISRLEAAVKEVAPRFTSEGDSFTITQMELNRASVGAASSYTRSEVSTFYRATQKLWQQEGVGEHDRNQAILDHYNSIREENGLSPISLEDIVDYVLEANKRFQAMQDLDPEKNMTEEQKKLYEEAQKADNEDNDKKSASEVSATVMAAIMDAMDDLITLPDPTDFDPQDFMDI